MNLAGCVIAACVVLGQANEPQEGQNKLKDLRSFIGAWEAEYTLPGGVPELGPAGTKVKDTATWRWALDRKFIVYRFRSEAEGQPPFTGMEVHGWDPKTNQMVVSLFNSTGAQGRGEWDRDGEGWILHWAVTQPDKTVYKGKSYLRRENAKSYIWGMTNVTRNGEKIPDWGPVTYHKVQGQQRRQRQAAE